MDSMRFKIVYGYMFRGNSRVISRHSSYNSAIAEFERVIDLAGKRRPLAIWFDQPSGEICLVAASNDFYPSHRNQQTYESSI